MPRVSSAFWVLSVAAAAAVSALPEGAARADSASGSCNLKGSVWMPVDLPIYDKSGTGSGSFRIDGYIQASKLPLFTKKDVPVVSGHLWIGAHREVTVSSAGTNKLRVKRHVGGPFDQDFSAWAPCSSLSFSEGTPAGWTPPGEARGYVAKKDVEVYDGSGSNKTLVSVLSPASGGNGILLWSMEKVGSFIHFEHHSDVVIDAWARISDLHELPEGETMDQIASGSSHRSPARLKLADSVREVTTSKEIAIRDSASENGTVIGHIESGTDTYVLDTVAGWSSVLPKALNVAPYGDAQFWVKASEL
jgi:hypothetical protein